MHLFLLRFKSKQIVKEQMMSEKRERADEEENGMRIRGKRRVRRCRSRIEWNDGRGGKAEKMGIDVTQSSDS